MKILFVLLSFISFKVFAMELTIEAPVTKEVKLEKIIAYYRYNNCPYFCHSNTKTASFHKSRSQFKGKLKFPERIRLTDFNRLGVSFTLNTTKGKINKTHYFSLKYSESQNAELESYKLNCVRKMDQSTAYYGALVQRVSDTCEGPGLPYGKEMNLKVKNFQVNYRDDFRDGEVLSSETFDPGYSFTIKNNGSGKVGPASQVSLNHDLGDAGIVKPATDRLREVVYSSTGKLLLATLEKGICTYFSYSEDPFSPEIHWGQIHNMPADVRSRCQNFTKILWLRNCENDDYRGEYFCH